MATNFQKKVWAVCLRIPKGKVTTYKLLAKAIKKPRAYRAVGNALNKNPEAPKVPCHRIIKSNGNIGGFAQGVRKKRKLLTNEGSSIIGNKIKDFEKNLFQFS